MSTRVYMLGFILSRMLNPISYTVFIVYFSVIAISTGVIIPQQKLLWIAERMGMVYMPLIVTGILASLLVFGFVMNFLYRVIVDGKFILRLSTFGLLLAISCVQLFSYFCMNALPRITERALVEKSMAFWFDESMRLMELISLLMMGLLLAMYVGELAKEKFKKNIGFVDDTLYD